MPRSTHETHNLHHTEPLATGDRLGIFNSQRTEGIQLQEFQNIWSEITQLAESGDSLQAYPPVLVDLASLFLLIRQEKIVSALEYGSGWSTLVIATALTQNKTVMEQSFDVRHPMPFMLTSVDASTEFSAIAVDRIRDEFVRSNVKPLVAKVSMTTYRDRYCHRFEGIPAVTADLIYLDGPDADQVSGDSNGFHIRFGGEDRTYGMPMSADILEYEAFLWPGTFLVVDGRGANARFLKHHLRREWQYHFSTKLDQHFFLLGEDAWGRESSRLLRLRTGRPLSEVVDSLEAQCSEIERTLIER